MQKKPLIITHLLLTLLVLLPWRSVAAPEGIDFSILTEDDPQTELSLTEGYKEALESTWHSLYSNSAVKWAGVYSDDYFACSATAISVTAPYSSYLVTSPLQLEAIGGKSLTFDLKVSSVKGEAPLRILLINKSGETLQTIYEQQYAKQDFTPTTVSIPMGLSGIGFIAFVNEGSKGNFASYNLKNIELSTPSMEITISYNPAEGLTFSEVGAGEVGATKELEIFIQNFTGTPQATVTGINQEDFLLNSISGGLTATGGKLSITFVPKKGNPNITASVTVVAGDKSVSIPLRGSATDGSGDTPPEYPEPQEDQELLADQFFYDFDATDHPIVWSYKGNVYKETNGYNSNTGFAVCIDQRSATETGQLYQEIDIDAVSYSMARGSVLEGQLYYSVQEPFGENQGIRLACQWLDADRKPIATAEDAFMASDRYVEWRKAWDELRFRTIVPEGARYFRFGVEVSAGSLVKVDDCSLVRLTALHAQDRFVSILPHALYREGVTTEPILGDILVQSMSSTQVEPIMTTPSGSFTLTPSGLPSGHQITTVSYAIQADAPGAYISGASGTKPYSIQYDGSNGWATMRINSYIIDPNNAPTVKLSDKTPNKKLTTTIGDPVEMELEFDVTGVIEEVKVQTASESGYFQSSTSSFYYSVSQKKVLNNKVKVTFSPRESGTYTATLTLTTACMDPLVVTITGEAQAASAEWMETFAEDRSMDTRFKGDNWSGYHRFDKGYYYLDGAWLETGGVSINPDGRLESDELMVYGIEHIQLTPAVANLEVLYTIDGGGHWRKAELEDGAYQIQTHRPTRFKVVNSTSSEITLEQIQLTQSSAQERQSLKDIASAMTPVESKDAQGKLEETFDQQRHTRGINLVGWQSFASLADRTFRGWEQKNKTTENVEETCAQITFFNSLDKDDSREQEAWLISPLLAKSKARSMYLTFRLRYELPTEDGQEQFGVYILTPDNEGGIKAQFIDISKQLLVPQIEPEKWYDYCIDLSKLEGIEIDELFYIAFTMYSPQGGTYTSLTFMIDDVTFGRTDLPEIKAEPNQINFIFLPNVDCTPQTIQVSVEHPNKPVTISLEPSKMMEEFKVSTETLPATGGDLAVGFSTKQEQARAAALLLQTRGGVSTLVRLLAQMDNGVESLQPLSPVQIYPTTATDYLHISITCQQYWIYTTEGALAQYGQSSEVVDISTLAPARYYIRLLTDDGGVATLPFDKL